MADDDSSSLQIADTVPGLSWQKRLRDEAIAALLGQCRAAARDGDRADVEHAIMVAETTLNGLRYGSAWRRWFRNVHRELEDRLYLVLS
jgi:hypothetical protein